MSKIKVLIIDDSAVIREIVNEVLSQDKDIEVVGQAEDPYVAREMIKRLHPDVLTLDVEMPKMDGITFLSNLMRLRPMPVVMLSTLTTKGADITFEALALGAVDFIAKPNVTTLIEKKVSFKDILISKIKSAAPINQKNFKISSTLNQDEAASILPFEGIKRKGHLIAIGASTGGTEAIKHILLKMPANAPPIVIVQHIPENFSRRFAERLNDTCQINVVEAKHGQKIVDGYAYIAPGNRHLIVKQIGTSLFCHLDDGEEVNRHKPAVDVLFKSLLPFAGNVQGVILTGMGQDGAKGLLALKDAGSRTVIQDKSSSLIWGMPGKAHAIYAHTHEYHLNSISYELLHFASLNHEEMKGVLNDCH